MLLPGELVNEAHLLLRGGVGAAVSIKDVALVEGVEVVDSLFVQVVEHLGGRRLVDASPPEIFVALRSNVFDNPFVRGRAAGELACVDSKRVAILGLEDATLLVGDLVVEQLGV